jgi:hypothetical protein
MGSDVSPDFDKFLQADCPETVPFFGLSYRLRNPVWRGVLPLPSWPVGGGAVRPQPAWGFTFLSSVQNHAVHTSGARGEPTGGCRGTRIGIVVPM